MFSRQRGLLLYAAFDLHRTLCRLYLSCCISPEDQKCIKIHTPFARGFAVSIADYLAYSTMHGTCRRHGDDSECRVVLVKRSRRLFNITRFCPPVHFNHVDWILRKNVRTSTCLFFRVGTRLERFKYQDN